MNATETIQPATTSPARNSARSALRRAADELVGEVFYGTLLRQMRESPLKGKYGHGGRGEEIFQAQLDTVFAARAGQSAGSNIADAVVDRFERNAEAAADYRNTLRARLDELQNMDMAQPQTGIEVGE